MLHLSVFCSFFGLAVLNQQYTRENISMQVYALEVTYLQRFLTQIYGKLLFKCCRVQGREQKLLCYLQKTKPYFCQNTIMVVVNSFRVGFLFDLVFFFPSYLLSLRKIFNFKAYFVNIWIIISDPIKKTITTC